LCGEVEVHLIQGEVCQPMLNTGGAAHARGVRRPNSPHAGGTPIVLARIVVGQV
jgi:hypothetical protein